MARKITYKGIQKKFHEWWREEVYKNAKYKCEVCGKKETLNPHHIITKRNLSTRFYIPNGCCLCSGCHVLNNKSAHKDGLWFSDFIREKRGEDWYKDLRNQANKTFKKYDIEQLYKEIINKYEKSINN